MCARLIAVVMIHQDLERKGKTTRLPQVPCPQTGPAPPKNTQPMQRRAHTVVLNAEVDGTSSPMEQPPRDICMEGTKSMDKDRIAGAAKQAKGAVKEAVGKVTGDAKLQTEGAADKVAGKVQNAAGGAKDAVRNAVKK